MKKEGLFLILPHQLFGVKFLNKKLPHVLWEHPHYFTAYRYNQKKIILHRGSMRYYYDYLKSKNIAVTYLSFTDTFDPGQREYTLFDPIDSLDLLKLPGTFTIIESPNFLLAKEQYSAYRSKTDKYFFNAFYMWGKKELDLLPAVKSQDKKNRKPFLPDDLVPELPSNKKDELYIKRGAAYVREHFSDNYGSTRDFIFPLTHHTARVWLRDFIKHRLCHFGDYQDAISQEHDVLYHSVLSTSINIGLLNPQEIVDAVMAYVKKHKKNKKRAISLNNLEGYIRQLFWREYQRYCYIYFDFDQYRSKKKRYFTNTKRLTKAWYAGSLGIDPVDDSIKKAFDTGYLHHIERLMIVGNFMNLSGIDPWQGFRWFMEFACDSYDWVMHQNVLEMVFFISGGATMRRPYSSSSNYILKMSDYDPSTWANKWDKQYHEFIKKNRKQLTKYRFYYGNF